MEEVWERAVESALDGQTDCSSARSLNLDGAVKYLHGRPLPPALLAKFQKLERLSLANVGVSSLENFPRLINLQKLVLSDNRIANGLEFLVGLDSLRDLDLSNNRIQFIEDLAPLAKLKLVSLDLYECPVTRVVNYRARVFAMIKSLRYLDNMDVHNNERPESDEEDEDEEEIDEDDEEDDDDPGSGEVDSEDQNAGVVDLKDGEKDDDGTTADGETGSIRGKEKRIIFSNGDREEEDVQGSDEEEEEEDVEDEGVDGDEQCANNADVQEEEDNEDEEEGDTLSVDHLTSTEGEIDEQEQSEEENGDDDDDDDDEGIEDGDHEEEDQDADEEEDDAVADYLVQPVVQTKGEAGGRGCDDGAEEAVDGEGCRDLPEPSSHSKRKRAEGDFDGALDGVPMKRR